jgi:hypothetical protein
MRKRGRSTSSQPTKHFRSDQSNSLPDDTKANNPLPSTDSYDSELDKVGHIEVSAGDIISNRCKCQPQKNLFFLLQLS